jgi:Sec-independent protein translocase protein TatA
MPTLSLFQIILLIALIFLLFGDVPGFINRLKYALKGLTKKTDTKK